MSRKATPDGITKRNRVFRHNSFMGFTSMTHRQMITIINSDSTTNETKTIANKISALCIELRQSLNTRVD